MTYRLVIFDFDGTLADTFPWFISVLDDVVEHFHLRRLPRGEIESLRECDAREVLKAFKVPLWKVPLIARHLKKRMALDIGRLSLFDGVDEVLRRLVAGKVRVALASSNSYENVAAVLGPERTGWFDDYECGASLFGKAAKLRKIVKRSGFAPGEVLCVGDEIRDITAAREARLACGAVSWGYTRAEALAAQEPDLMFATMAEIAEKLVGTQPVGNAA